MSVTKAVLASSTFALIATTTPVLAQERTADARLSSEEIIVTARRREENIQDVPVAITALGTEALEKANITDVEDLNGAVPALLITPATTVGNSTLNFSIRGLNQGEYTGLADPSVSLYVNDVAVPRAYLANLGLYDIESVQVLRGPQGTLFGRNTTGGAVLVNSKRPEDRFTASLQGTIGNFDTYELEGHVNLPIGGSGGLRLAARHEETGGYVTNTLTGNKVDHENRDSFRVSFLADPDENFQSLFVFEYNDLNDGGPGFYARPGSVFGAITQVNSIYETQSNTTEFTKASLLSFTNDTKLGLSDTFSLRNIFGFRDLNYKALIDNDGAAAFLLTIPREIEQHQFSDELQLLGDFDWGNVILGAYYFHEYDNDRGYSVGAFSGCGAAQGPELPGARLASDYPCYSVTWPIARNTSKAVFAQTSINFTDTLSATVGARYSWDTRKATFLNRNTATGCRFTLDLDGNPATPEVRPSLDNCRLDAQAKFSEPTYNISLEYKPTSDFLAYIAHRHGYRAGGYGARASSEQGLLRTFLPETVDDVEIGLKKDWQFGTMFARTNVAAYYNKYKDIQRLLTDPNTIPPTTVTANAGSATIKGLEIEGLIRPVPWFELSGFYSLTDANFKEFFDLQGNDLSDNPFARAPKHLAGATARVEVPTGVGEASLALRWVHVSEYSSGDNFIVGVHDMEGYDIFNLTGGISGLFNDMVDLRFYVDNLFDKEYSQAGIGIGTTTINALRAGAPRTYGLSLRVKLY